MKRSDLRGLYLCRKSILDHSILFEKSIASKNKILSIENSFRISRIPLYVIPTFRKSASKVYVAGKVKRDNGSIVIVPPTVNFFGRHISYALNIFFNCVIAFRLRKKIHLVIGYNIVPDVTIPQIILRLVSSNIYNIAEIEESIKFDKESGLIFKLFEVFASKILYYNLVLALNNRLVNLVKAKRRAVIPGIIPAKFLHNDCIAEESETITSEINVLFLGRLDFMRCISEFLDAIPLVHRKVNYKIIGYINNQSYQQELRKKLHGICADINVEFIIDAADAQVEDALRDASVCISLVRDSIFLENSFPSKLIEYLYFNKIVVSQRILDCNLINNFVWIDSVDPVEIARGIDAAIRTWEVTSKSELVGRSWVLKHCTAEAMLEQIILCKNELSR